MRSPGRQVDRGFPTKGVIAGFVITVGEDGFALAQAPADSRRLVKVKTRGPRALLRNGLAPHQYDFRIIQVWAGSLAQELANTSVMLAEFGPGLSRQRG